MSEQQEGKVTEPQELEVSSEGTEQELSEIEQEAMSHGWTPEGVEGKRNLTAEEFMDRQPLYDDLKQQKKQIKRLQEGMEAMRQHTATVAANERQRVLAELKAAKKTALEGENYDAVVEIDERIAETKAQADTPPSNEVFQDWVEENDWYNQDTDMRAYADTIGTGYFQNNPTKTTKEVYEYVSKEVKSRYPEKFGNPNRGKPSPVEGAAKGRQSTSKRYSVKDLPEADRQIMKTILRSGSKMTEQEYLKQYFGE